MTSLEDYLVPDNPNEEGFSASVAAILFSIGAESYIPLFKEANISKKVLSDFSDVDLMMLGIDCAEKRTKILDALKCLGTINSDNRDRNNEIEQLTNVDIYSIIIDNKKHLNRIYLSLKANRISLMKMLHPEDVLLKCSPEAYASDVMLQVYDNMEELICNMEHELNKLRDILPPTTRSYRFKRKKYMIATVGSALVVILTIAFLKSLKS